MPRNNLGDGAVVLASKANNAFGMSPQMIQTFEQAARVCLHKNAHDRPVSMTLQHEGVRPRCKAVRVQWKRPTAKQLRSFGDEATEFGAVAVALHLMREVHGYVNCTRSRRGTGFDYWIGKTPGPLMNGKVRLEISGILAGSDAEVAKRSREKVEQMKKGGVAGAGFAAVVNFGPPASRITFVKGGS